MQENQRHMIYSCPMHPDVRREQPGLCPECGMALVPEQPHDHGEQSQAHETFDKHAGHSPNMFARRFFVCLALSAPVVLYSELPARLINLAAPVFPGSQYLGAVLGTVIFLYGGSVFLRGAYRELKARLPGMMTLVALAISAAYFYSMFAAVTGKPHTLFWELATLVTIMLLGHWFEMKAVQDAQGALRELSKLLPDTAEVVRGAETETIPLRELAAGDAVLVRPGGKIPADGIVVQGSSDVNESVATGESKPVPKRVDAEVIAGTTNGDGALTVRITKVGEQTFLAGVMRLVADAQASKSRLQTLSDRAAFFLTLVAVTAGGLTFVVWFVVSGDPSMALERLVAVLVIACPHALGLAIPLVASVATTLAARNGFLVRRRLGLEASRDVSMVLFDKTGTLTRGEYGMVAVSVSPGVDMSAPQLLLLAASADAHSEHFVARAIVSEAQRQGIALRTVDGFTRVPGKGVLGVLDGERVAAGSEALMTELNAAVPEALMLGAREHAARGETVVYVARSNGAVGIIALSDTLREESRAAVRELQQLGVRVGMITGDSEEVAAQVARDLGITEYFARTLPDRKAEIIRSLQRTGVRIAFVGDGVNDAPALAQADVGIVIGAGTNVAIESAAVILVRNDPRDIPRIIRLSRLTYTKMLQNLAWAAGYNVVALPLAAGALASRGILLQPAVSAVLMSISTIIVAFNAVRLARARI